MQCRDILKLHITRCIWRLHRSKMAPNYKSMPYQNIPPSILDFVFFWNTGTQEHTTGTGRDGCSPDQEGDSRIAIDETMIKKSFKKIFLLLGFWGVLVFWGGCWHHVLYYWVCSHVPCFVPLPPSGKFHPVSYTPLTLPTNVSLYISVFVVSFYI